VEGFFYIAVVDPSAPGGIKEQRIAVSGVADGSQVNFSNMVGWVARASWGGFTLTVPGNGGYLAQEHFRSVDTDAVNSAISALHQNAGQAQAVQAAAQQRANVATELDDAETRLQNDLNLRPDRLNSIVEAKADVSRAEAQIQKANDNIAARQADVVDAQKVADDAKAVAVTGADFGHVGALQGEVGAKEGEVGAARGELGAAQGQLSAAQSRLDFARGQLSSLDARIAQLRQIISRDKAFLHIP
jgi:chromosome segregation ATPase